MIKAIAIIPAKTDSKRLKKKNLRVILTIFYLSDLLTIWKERLEVERLIVEWIISWKEKEKEV